jgi:hypothetical protein
MNDNELKNELIKKMSADIATKAKGLLAGSDRMP